ncbi:CTP synthase [Gossypium arboreum]|uniref:CTP synthase n=1 Tax=Gossypium arboreum TaxID=29729 RepID=A0A0B0PN59_GOSAR|nr:CTP synthase [Gossypium arboreum]
MPVCLDYVKIGHTYLLVHMAPRHACVLGRGILPLIRKVPRGHTTV